jgi:predicted nucleic acid-binding Zn ribbon protein
MTATERQRTAGETPCEKNSFRKAVEKGSCELCGATFNRSHPAKRFCSERCQRLAEQRRYRRRHTEIAACKGCGRTVSRSTTTKRKQLYCTTDCQAESRSREYRGREDIQAGIARAREARQPEPAG